MILHGNPRGHGRDLAIHLLRDDENDHVEVHEVRGFMANDVRGAFQEVQAMASATKAKQYLFSLSLSPPKGGNVSTEDFEKAIERAEQALGLAGQPRVIVFHEKGDHRDRHAHAVWSRIDSTQSKAIPVPFNKLRLREVSRELFIQHGWNMPSGLINREERNPLNYSFDEYQHAKRAGRDAKTIKADLQDAWAMSDSGPAFAHALKEKGFRLARGDRRGFLAVDTKGEPYSIPKWLDLKTKAVRERLGDEKNIPSPAETKAAIGRDMLAKMSEHEQELQARNARRKDQSKSQRQALIEHQRTERATALRRIETRRIDETKARQARFRSGLRGAWDWLRGENKRIKRENEADAARCLARDMAEREALLIRQRDQRLHIRQSLVKARMF
ncbi:MAG: relaxase [Pseudomonadota bacterium]